MNKNVDRRDFIRKAGLGLAGMAIASNPVVIGRTRDGYLVKSKDEYGDFVVEKLSGKNLPYEIDPQRLKRMNELYTIFSRNDWDPIRQDRPEKSINYMRNSLVKGEGKVPNQTRLDYAFMAAAWGTSSFRGSPFYSWHPVTGQVMGMTYDRLGKWNPADIDMGWDEVSIAVKHAALFYGASLAGIAELNRLWIYSDFYSPDNENPERTTPVISDGDRYERTTDTNYIPESMNRVVALAFEEDYDAIMNSPGRLASAACGDGYSRMAVTSYKLAEFIRALGYRALPAGNGVGLSIPISIDAGLGELGRNGLLLTPKFGPRVRLAKVITDMPLLADTPINFGVKEFCEACMTCSDDCPSGSIPTGPMSWDGITVSNNPGAHKWYVNQESCYDFNGFSCSNCKRNCPFNKPNNSWLHKAIRTAIDAKSVRMDKFMVTLDQASGYGVQEDSSEFWDKDGLSSITAREKM